MKAGRSIRINSVDLSNPAAHCQVLGWNQPPFDPTFMVSVWGPLDIQIAWDETSVITQCGDSKQPATSCNTHPTSPIMDHTQITHLFNHGALQFIGWPSRMTIQGQATLNHEMLRGFTELWKSWWMTSIWGASGNDYEIATENGPSIVNWCVVCSINSI